MKKYLLILIALLITVLTGCSGTGSTSEPVDLSVMAVSSLKAPMEEIKNNYESSSNNTLNYSFSSSQEITDDLIGGSRTDFIILSSEKNLSTLESESLINPSTKANLVTNSLVVITSAKSTLKSGEDLASWEVNSICLTKPDKTTSGYYAEQTLANTGMANSLGSKITYVNNVRNLLKAVSDETVSAGIVFKSDAVNNANIKIIYEFPPESYDTINYPMASFKIDDTEENKSKIEAINDFENYLKSEAAQTIFNKYGFNIAQTQ